MRLVMRHLYLIGLNPGDDHSQRPSYNEGGTAYQFMSSHFKKPSPDVPEDRKVYDENGRLLGWFDNAGPAKSGFAGKGFTSKRDAFIHAQESPYQMNRGTEGEMWMGQRENIFRQDLDFANREAANSLSIRKHQFDDNLLMDRKKARWDYSTMNQLRGENLADTQMLQERHWSWQQAHAGEEGQAFVLVCKRSILELLLGIYFLVVLLLVLVLVLFLVFPVCRRLLLVLLVLVLILRLFLLNWQLILYDADNG